MRAGWTLAPVVVTLAAGALTATGPAAHASSPTLTVPSAVHGERVTATGRVPATASRTVRLQRLAGGTWRTIASTRSTARGTFRVALTQPSGRATYRAFAPRSGHRPTSRTTSRTVVPRAQRAAISLAATARAGTSVTADVSFTPARPGRPFVVERRDGSRWVTVARGTQTTRGTARTTIDVGDEGARTFRVTATRYRGAVPVAGSASVDVLAGGTPPASPELVSVRPDGSAAKFPSHRAAADHSGRWIVFTSTAADLGVTNPEGHEAVWLRDTLRRTTVLVSRTPAGAVADGDSGEPSISADGRFVAYSSSAGDLVQDDHDLDEDVFLFDRVTGSTSLVSRRTTRTSDLEGRSLAPAISPNGRYITYSSDDEGVTGHRWMQVMRHDRVDRSTVLVSTGPAGPGVDGISLGSRVSDDGLVAFRSSSPRLTGRATAEIADIFLHAPGRSALENVTRQGNAGGSGWFDLSADGSRLVFQSQSWNLPGAHDDDLSDVFVLERDGDQIHLLSTSQHPEAEHRYPSISDDGRTVTWLSLRDEPDGSRVLQMIAADVQLRTERPVTSVLDRDPSASTVWPLDVSGDGRTAVYRTRRPDLTGDPTGIVDQVVRQAVPR